MIGSAIAYDPCFRCNEKDKCTMCELTYYRNGQIVRSAEVVEVVHASWNWEKQNGQWGYYCTNCHAGFVDSENVEWIAKSHDYCPKCGAKMDGERIEK